MSLSIFLFFFCWIVKVFVVAVLLPAALTLYPNVQSNWAKCIPSNMVDPTSLSVEKQSSMFLSPTDVHKVHWIVKDLKHASARWDNVSTWEIKGSCDSYFIALTNIFNLSFSQWIRICINSYRPVLIYPVFLNNCEHLVQKRLNSFIEKYNILYQCQLGFLKNHRTNTVLNWQN